MMADRPENHELEVEISTPEGLAAAEQPYRILLLADMSGSKEGSISGLLQDSIVEVNANSFDGVMADACPTVSYTAADPLAPDKRMVEVNLRFDSLKAFDPKSLTERLPPTKSLMAAREQIVQRLLGKTSAAQMTAQIGGMATSDTGLDWLPQALKWVSAPPSPAPQAVDSLLDQIDLGDAGDDSAAADASPSAKSPIGAVVAKASHDETSASVEESSALRRALAEIDRRLQQWLTAVLHAPQVRAIEAAWRSLAFLVSHIDFRKSIRLSLLHAPIDELNERLSTVLIDAVFDEGLDAPDLIVAETHFGCSAAEVETLDELARHAASLPAVVLAGVGPGFFGVKHAWQVSTLPTLNTMFDQWKFAKWKSLRTQPHAQSLGVVFGRCLLRPPYSAPPDAKDLKFSYREPTLTDSDLLWSGGALVVACTVAHSVEERGWPTAMAGIVHGRVAGFSTTMGGKNGDKEFGPSDTKLNETRIEEMALVGINAVASDRNRDDLIFWNGLTAARPEKLDASALLEVSLPYQLFATRMSNLLLLLKEHLTGKPPEQIVSFVRDHVLSWLPGDEHELRDLVKIHLGSPEDDPSATILVVTVTPPQSILAGGIPIVLGYRLQ